MVSQDSSPAPAPVRPLTGLQPQPTTAVVVRFSLRPGAHLDTTGPSTVALREGRFETVLQQSSPGWVELLRRLAGGWVDETDVSRIAAARDGERAGLTAQLLLHRLHRQGWLAQRIGQGGRRLIEVVPQSFGARPTVVARSVRGDLAYRLSRLVRIDQVEDRFALRSGRAPTTVVVDDPRVVAAVSAAVAGSTLARFAVEAGLDEGVATAVVGALLAAGVLVRPDERVAEETTPPLQFWSSDELAVHDRSRAGGHTLPIGGTFRFREVSAPEPLRKPAPTGPRVALPVPDLAAVAAAEDSLTAVVQRRRSVREHDDLRPIDRDQLAEFLYRTQFTGAVDVAAGQEVGRRPYPGGGRICELEVYAVVRHCAGLGRGLYWYDSLEHEVLRLAEPAAPVDRLIAFARAAAGAVGPPQVLLVITSRLSRLAWKYEGLAYSMTLRNAGVLLGHMYLVATAMGLAPCALGTGDSAAFAQATGLDPHAEPCVADFTLGSIGGAR